MCCRCYFCLLNGCDFDQYSTEIHTTNGLKFKQQSPDTFSVAFHSIAHSIFGCVYSNPTLSIGKLCKKNPHFQSRSISSNNIQIKKNCIKIENSHAQNIPKKKKQNQHKKAIKSFDNSK